MHFFGVYSIWWTIEDPTADPEFGGNPALASWENQKKTKISQHTLNCMTHHASWGLASNWCHLLEGASAWVKSEGDLNFPAGWVPSVGWQNRCFGLFDSACLMVDSALVLGNSRLFWLGLNVKMWPSQVHPQSMILDRNSNEGWSRREPFQIQRIQMAHWPQLLQYPFWYCLVKLRIPVG